MSSMREKLVGWTSSKDRNRFFLSLGACAVIYVGVLVSESRERLRRHSSIHKDIEREKWRAKQLGVDRVEDDGFSEEYIHDLRTRGTKDIVFDDKGREFTKK